MQLWVFMSAPCMGTSTLLKRACGGDAELKRKLKIPPHVRTLYTESSNNGTAPRVPHQSPSTYRLHKWNAAEDPKEALQQADRVIALHLPLHEWVKRHNCKINERHTGQYLPWTMRQAAWYYTHLANLADSRTGNIGEIYHWDMVKQKYLDLGPGFGGRTSPPARRASART